MAHQALTRSGTDSDAAALSSLRLTPRGRMVLWGLGALLVCMSVFFASTAVASDPDPAIAVTTATVMEGETLWHFAKEIAAPDEDLRDVVALIQDLNDLPSAELQIGQQLLLPANQG